jgi:hypothetical protein
MNFKRKMNVINIIIINVYDLYKIRITNTYYLYNKCSMSALPPKTLVLT